MDEQRGNDGAEVLGNTSQSDAKEEDVGSASLLLSKVKEEESAAQSLSSEFWREGGQLKLPKSEFMGDCMFSLFGLTKFAQAPLIGVSTTMGENLASGRPLMQRGSRPRGLDIIC